MTADGQTLIDNFERSLRCGLSGHDLNSFADGLAQLKSEWPTRKWQDFCRSLCQKQIRAALQIDAPLLSTWENSLPSVQGRAMTHSLFAFEIREAIRMLPGARILALGETPLHPVDFQGAEEALFASDLRVGQTLSRRAARLRRFDFIYTSDWLNRSCDARAIEWLRAATGLLGEGGRLLGSNLTPGARDSAYLEARWNAWPVYRDEHDLANLAARLTDTGLRGHAVFRDDASAMTFLEIQAA